MRIPIALGSFVMAAACGLAAQAPIANAGPDRQLKLGKMVYLDGTRSAPFGGASADALLYEWTLVTKPIGSQAVLSNASSARPSFAPDLRGTYVAQLVVKQGEVSSIAKDVTISVNPDAPLHSVKTRIISGDGSSVSDYCVELDTHNYCATGGSLTGMFVLTLDRTTLEVAGQQTFDTTNGPQPVITYLSQVGSDKIVILSTLQQSGPDISKLAASLESIGTTQAFRGITNDFLFTVIGIKGLQSGQAWEAGGGAPLIGSFVPDSNANFTFAQFDYVKFELIPSTAQGKPSTITIGNQTAIQSDANAPGGFLLVIVNRATLSTSAGDGAFVQNYYTLNNDAQTEELRTKIYQTASDPDKMIFLVSFGSPAGGHGPDLANLANNIDAIGGTYDVVNYLNAGDTYSLVSAQGTAAESSSRRTPKMPQGILRGVLGRGKQGNRYGIVSTSLTRSADLDLYTYIAQPEQNWPVPVTNGQQQAFSWIGQRLCGSCTDLRFAYSDTNIDLSAWSAQLSFLGYPAGQSFTEAEFNQVKSQLLTEFGYVDSIQKFQTNIASLWTDQQANFGLLANAVGAKVKTALNPPPASLFYKFLGDVISTAISTAETILSDGIVDVVKEEVKLNVPSAILQSVLGIGTSMAKDAAGNDAETTAQIDNTVAKLEERTAYQFAQELTSLGTIFDIVVVDWGKIQGLGSKLSNPDNRQWFWNGSVTTGQLLQSMTVSMETGIYRSLMNDEFRVLNWDAYEPYFDPGNFNDGDDLVPHHSWENWPKNAWMSALDNGEGAYVLWLDKDGFNKETVPPILQHLYAPVSQDGLGVYKPDVFRHWGFPRFYCYDYRCDNRDPGLTAAPPPRITIAANVDSTIKHANRLQVKLRLTNNGNVSAHNLTVTNVSVQALEGAGQITYTGRTPVTVGTIPPGASTILRLNFQVPAAVKAMSINEQGTFENGNKVMESFSLEQVVVP